MTANAPACGHGPSSPLSSDLRADNTPLWKLSEVRLPDATGCRHWWTVIDCAGGLYLAAGFRFVNRLCYVRCEVPWTDADALIDYRYD